MSGEIAWCAERLSKFCVGNGCDLGFGGSPIVPHAICMDRAPGHPERKKAEPTDAPTQLVGDVRELPFKDGVLDFVASSHCLEDLPDTAAALVEWCRVLKEGGKLVLFLPDQRRYEAHCAANHELPNGAHKHKDFSLEYVKARLPGNMKVIYELNEVPGNPYSFDLVAVKEGVTPAQQQYRDKMYED